MHVAAQASADLARVSSQTWQNKAPLAWGGENKKKEKKKAMITRMWEYLKSQIHIKDLRFFTKAKTSQIQTIMDQQSAHTGNICPKFGQNPCPHHQRKAYIHVPSLYQEKPLKRHSPTIFPSMLMRSMCGEEWNTGWGPNGRLKQRNKVHHRYYIPCKTLIFLK